LVDNSASPLEIVAEGTKNQSNKVVNMSLYKTIENYD
jgi:hypothetical protein